MIIYILIAAHFLADFTFQPAKLAEKKAEKFGALILHSLIYAVVFFIAIFTFVKFEGGILPYTIIAVSHFLIDWGRKKLDSKICQKAVVFSSFLIDQIFHILILVLTTVLFSLDKNTNNNFAYFQGWEHFHSFILYLLTVMIIWDPAAVFIKKLFAYISEDSNSIMEGNEPQIGRIIGKLERLIISILVLCGQFGTIGFVLAAKSIARYKQLEDKNFAEKYLVGTLASAAIAVITALVLKHFI